MSPINHWAGPLHSQTGYHSYSEYFITAFMGLYPGAFPVFEFETIRKLLLLNTVQLSSVFTTFESLPKLSIYHDGLECQKSIEHK